MDLRPQAGMSRRPSTTTGRPMTGSVPPLSESFSAWAGSGGVGDRFQCCAHCLGQRDPTWQMPGMPVRHCSGGHLGTVAGDCASQERLDESPDGVRIIGEGPVAAVLEDC